MVFSSSVNCTDKADTDNDLKIISDLIIYTIGFIGFTTFIYMISSRLHHLICNLPIIYYQPIVAAPAG